MKIFFWTFMAEWINSLTTWVMDVYGKLFTNYADVGLNLSKLLPLIANFEQKAGDVCLDMAITLITVKFLKKGFETYISYTDGDADSDPIYLVTLYCKAIGSACSFNVVYDYFISAIQKFINALLGAVGMSGVPSVESMLAVMQIPGTDIEIEYAITQNNPYSFVIVILLLVFVILCIVLFFKMCKTGVENMLLKIGFPLATIGLLDADKGIFKMYFMSLVKNIFTVILQLVMLQMALASMVDNLNESITSKTLLFSIVISIVLLVTALSTPKLLAEFLIPSGGSLNMATLYYGRQMLAGGQKATAQKVVTQAPPAP